MLLVPADQSLSFRLGLRLRFGVGRDLRRRNGEGHTSLLLDQVLSELERDRLEPSQAGRLFDSRPCAPTQIRLVDSPKRVARVLGPLEFSPVIADLVVGPALALDEALDHLGREDFEDLAAAHRTHHGVGIAGGQPAALANRHRLFLRPPDRDRLGQLVHRRLLGHETIHGLI